jgi:hypothetical protein
MTKTTQDFVTKHAQRGDHVASILEAALTRVFTDYTVRITRPEPSTHGGHRATQHIQLLGKDGRELVVGSMNTTEHKATLRTLGHTLSISKRRFGREHVLPPLEYVRFLEVSTKVLAELELQVLVVAYDKIAEATLDPEEIANSASTTRPFAPYVAGLLASVSAVIAIALAVCGR